MLKQPPTKSSSSASKQTSTPLLIHLLDDDLFFQDIIKRYLKPHAVHSFTNALDAIDALSDELPDLIILDILLDGPDGFTYLNEISSYADTNCIPVILISSLYHKLPKMSSYNVYAYLDKTTFTPDELQKIVAEIMTKNPNSPNPARTQSELKVKS